MGYNLFSKLKSMRAVSGGQETKPAMGINRVSLHTWTQMEAGKLFVVVAHLACPQMPFLSFCFLFEGLVPWTI